MTSVKFINLPRDTECHKSMGKLTASRKVSLWYYSTSERWKEAKMKELKVPSLFQIHTRSY